MPLNRPGTGLYPKGKERVERILNAARDILIRSGYSSLTMRNVAREAGTTVGNLQYYYSDKDRLLRNLLEYMVHEFLEDFQSIQGDSRRSAEQKLIAYIDRIFDAFPGEAKSRFYPELWALSNHDATAAKLMEDMYERVMTTLRSIIGEMNPALTTREAKEMAVTILGSIEGLLVFVGHGRPWSSSLKAVRRYTVRSCVHMVNSGGRTLQEAKTRARPAGEER